MKKLLFLVPALLVVCLLGAPNAHADSYTPTFSCTNFFSSDFGCSYIPNGSTGPNVSFPSPTVQISVGNEQYGVTLPATDSATDSYSYQFLEMTGPSNLPGYDGPPVTTGAVYAFGVFVINDLTSGTADTDIDFLGNFVPGDNDGLGTLTFSPVSAAAPEPAPVLLLFFGAGLIFLMRKRFTMSQAV